MTAIQATSIRRILRVILCSAVGILLTGPLSAQPLSDRDQVNDLLDQVRREQEVAAQKIEAEVRQALGDAVRLISQSPARASESLRKIQAFLEKDTLLPTARRDALKKILKDKIQLAEAEISTPKGKDMRPATISARRAEEDRKAAENERAKIRKALEAIQNLQAEGKTGQASREASDLASRQPQNGSLQASERSAQAMDQLASARRLQKEREGNMLGAYRDIDRSSTPAGGDVEFPKDWRVRTRNRSTATKLTVKEKEILKALGSEITVNFKDSKLVDVLEYLKTRLDLNILIDHEALKDAEISYDTPITLNLKKVAARTVLRKLFADLGMTYVVKDESIYVVSAQKARELMVVRSYYVADLLASMGAVGMHSEASSLPLAPALPAGQPLQAAVQAVQNANTLIEIIKTSVDAQTWRDNGGAGTITFHAPSLSLIIKQSAEVHALLANGGLVK